MPREFCKDYKYPYFFIQIFENDIYKTKHNPKSSSKSKLSVTFKHPNDIKIPTQHLPLHNRVIRATPSHPWDKTQIQRREKTSTIKTSLPKPNVYPHRYVLAPVVMSLLQGRVNCPEILTVARAIRGRGASGD